MRRAIVLVAVLVVVLGACSSTDTSETTATLAVDVLQTAESVAYSTTSAKTLDVYSPVDQGSWPVVIVVHGVSQGKRSFAPLAEAIASRGAVVFNVDATMSAPFDGAIAEVACSIRLAKATAAEYGGDPARVTLVGNSAGATTGVIVALAGDDVARDCIADGPVELDAIVGYEGPFDWATTVYGSIDLPALESADPDLWSAVDPYHHVGGNRDLVVRLIHGDDSDQAWYEVPRAVSVEFHQALSDAGYDAEITLVDGASHTAIAGPGSGEAFETTVDQAIELARG